MSARSQAREHAARRADSFQENKMSLPVGLVKEIRNAQVITASLKGKSYWILKGENILHNIVSTNVARAVPILDIDFDTVEEVKTFQKIAEGVK